MRNRIVQQLQRDNLERATERAAGREWSIISFTSQAEVAQSIADISKLPSAPNDTRLQDDDGNFLYLPDYSDPDGPDVIE